MVSQIASRVLSSCTDDQLFFSHRRDNQMSAAFDGENVTAADEHDGS